MLLDVDASLLELVPTDTSDARVVIEVQYLDANHDAMEHIRLTWDDPLRACYSAPFAGSRCRARLPLVHLDLHSPASPPRAAHSLRLRVWLEGPSESAEVLRAHSALQLTHALPASLRMTAVILLALFVATAAWLLHWTRGLLRQVASLRTQGGRRGGVYCTRPLLECILPEQVPSPLPPSISV